MSDIVERLCAVESSEVCETTRTTTNWYRNPDGPEAAEEIKRLRAEVERLSSPTFDLGDRVRKKSGSEWQGIVVGFYSTTLNPDGICVESENHAGSVQIYPAKALQETGDE